MLGIPGTPSIPGDPIDMGKSLLSGGGGSHSSSAPAPSSGSAASDEALMYMSDNNKETALAQVQAQNFQMQQAVMDRELQLAANMELGLEKLDTNLQTATLQFQQTMNAEENRHVEKMAHTAANKLQGIQSTYSLGADLPPPPVDGGKA